MHQDQRPTYFVNLGWGPGGTLWLRAGAVQLRCKRCKSMWHPHNWRGELGRRCTKQKGAVLRCTSQGWRGNRYDWTPGRELRRRLRGQAEGGGSSHLTHRTALGGRSYYYPRWSNFPQLVRFTAGTQTPNPKSTLSPMLSPLCSQCCGVGNDWQGWRAGGRKVF